MREIRPSGSEGGVALTPPSLPLSFGCGFAALCPIVDLRLGGLSSIRLQILKELQPGRREGVAYVG